MAFDIHPIVVHFPIALLFVYSLIKIIPLSKWWPDVSWRQIERVLLIIGVAGAFVALATGDAASHQSRTNISTSNFSSMNASANVNSASINQTVALGFKPNRAILRVHSTFAQLTTWLYGILLFGELVAFVNEKKLMIAEPHFDRILRLIEIFLTNHVLCAILALIALIALFMTGLLGGAMVYGTTADPLAKIILPWFGIAI